jgi:hypothetical protein
LANFPSTGDASEYALATIVGAKTCKVGKNPNGIWVNYNDLTTTSLEIMVSKGNHPQMALIQVSEIL